MSRRIIRTVVVMFSTYTAIPMPQVEWDDDTARLAIGFFPLAGVVIGSVIFGWKIVSGILGIGDLLYGAVAVSIPVLITGGIHMDGFCDTIDAMFSYQPKDRKLEIMKDPNAGAFAVIYCCVYMLVSFGMLTQAREDTIIVSLGYILSRSLSAINAVTIKNARDGRGMLAYFTTSAHRRGVLIMCIIGAVIVSGVMILYNAVTGCVVIAAVLAVMVWYRRMTRKEFGGATGDTSGFYLQVTELAVLIGSVVGGVM